MSSWLEKQNKKAGLGSSPHVVSINSMRNYSSDVEKIPIEEEYENALKGDMDHDKNC